MQEVKYDNWSKMNQWDLVIPPSRPSARQLDAIILHSQCLERHANVAVLGSTPEFRDLLYQLGFTNIYIFDRNADFYRAMSSLRVYENPEYFIQGDWLNTLCQHERKFMMILSDLTSGNIPYESRRQFYLDISNALAPGGVFIDKVLTHPGEHLSIECLLEKYMSLPINLVTVNYFSCEFLFCSNLLDMHQVVNSSLFYETLKNRTNHRRLAKFIDLATFITPYDCYWYYGKFWHELEKDYCPDLDKFAIYEDEDQSPYFGRAKQYVLRRS